MTAQFGSIIPADLGVQLHKAITGLTGANSKCKKQTDVAAYEKCISGEYGALASKFKGDGAVVGDLITLLKDNWAKDVAACATNPATKKECTDKAALKVIQALFKVMAGVFTSSLAGGQ